MRAAVVGLVVLAVGIILAMLWIVLPSDSNEDSRISETTSATNAGITLWLEGKESESLQLMLSSEKDSEAVMHTLRELELSEREFMNLGRREMQESNARNIDISKAARALARAMVAAAEQAQSQANEAEAKRIFGLVRQMSDDLSDPEHTLMIQQIGTSILKVLGQE